ncbi:MAG: hypothetical protein QG670_1855 [Thermoproteota archaeon]|nr:hypothetical protein [Thermoproteota archaeon]
MSYLVKDYMSRDVVTIDIDASALEVSKLLTAKEIGYVIVLEKSQPKGIITELDLVTKVMAKEKNSSMVKISEIMSTPLITVDLNGTVEDAVKTMAKYKIRRLPVVKDNVIYGIFTTRDLTRNFSKYADKLTRDLINAQTLYGNYLQLSF